MAADPAPPTPGPRVPSGPTSMLELGAALGADVWWLDQVFALAGGWVASTDHAVVRAHLAETSRVAGDHAVALRGHLPRPTGVDPEGWVAPPWPGATDLVDAASLLSGDAARLAVLHRVLVMRLVVGWGAPLGASATGPVRVIGHARTDLAALRDEGEALLHALFVVEPAAMAAAHDAAASIESSLVSGGGVRPVGTAGLPG